ncbi:hypothetical protein CQY20_16645 [Mycolicibacterium agri]|uniref:Lipoprotein n=1 Tax=Mycolicibacterium agri TaxID=36811 RepID=A0A2A7N090_MYCAG|nr:hypothetical protein CQY20_16645 [Mycolicibacterium agri]
MPVLTRRRIATLAGALTMAAVFAAGCQSSGDQEPSTTTPTTTTPTSATPPPTTTAPPAPPTEKRIDPTGGNLFTPEIKAPPAPTEPPGVHRNKH